MAQEITPDVALDSFQIFLNRELSWLALDVFVARARSEGGAKMPARPVEARGG